MQHCSTEKVHSREAATGWRTSENSCRHRHASNPLWEQTLLRSHGVDTDVGGDVGLITCVFGWCDVILPNSSVSYFADVEVSVRGSGNRRIQERQVSV